MSDSKNDFLKGLPDPNDRTPNDPAIMIHSRDIKSLFRQ